MAHDSENKMDRYSFLVGLFHPQHHAGFGRRFRVALWFFGYYMLELYFSSLTFTTIDSDMSNKR